EELHDVAGYLSLFETRGAGPGSFLNKEGGCLSLTSCNHVAHLECLKNYLRETKPNANNTRTQELYFYAQENNEFACPLCRSVCNGLLPLNEPICMDCDVGHNQDLRKLFDENFAQLTKETEVLLQTGLEVSKANGLIMMSTSSSAGDVVSSTNANGEAGTEVAAPSGT
ncbi:unnamed protein product, partial [Amoebophrya sp. A120]